MDVYLNEDGTIEKKIASRNFQGSNGVNAITLHGEFPFDSEIKINFRLPDGSRYFETMSYSNYGIWSIPLRTPVTDQCGQVYFSFTIITTEKLTTPAISIFIEESVILDDIT